MLVDEENVTIKEPRQTHLRSCGALGHLSKHLVYILCAVVGWNECGHSQVQIPALVGTFCVLLRELLCLNFPICKTNTSTWHLLDIQ